MGGAQPLAATMAGASMLAIECRQSRIDKRLETGYLDQQAHSLDDALAMIATATARAEAVSIGLCGNAAELLPELLRRGVRPDAVTDQTSAHDPVHGYLPAGWTVPQWEALQASDAARVSAAASASMATHVRAMLEYKRMGIPTFDYGNNIRQVALGQGVKDAFDIPGFVPEYVRPLFCRGIGPFRWAALSGDPARHCPHRRQGARTDSQRRAPAPLARHGGASASSSRDCRRASAGWAWASGTGLAWPSTKWWRQANCAAPIVIGRDHLDSGSVASPNRETEAMLDGSDAVSDWPLLNALLNTASGATWVSFHHGGGVGMGFSQHARGRDRVRRDARGGAPYRARAVERSGQRRHASRRCRLSELALHCAREHSAGRCRCLSAPMAAVRRARAGAAALARQGR